MKKKIIECTERRKKSEKKQILKDLKNARLQIEKLMELFVREFQSKEQEQDEDEEQGSSEEQKINIKEKPKKKHISSPSISQNFSENNVKKNSVLNNFQMNSSYESKKSYIPEFSLSFLTVTDDSSTFSTEFSSVSPSSLSPTSSTSSRPNSPSRANSPSSSSPKYSSEKDSNQTDLDSNNKKFYFIKNNWSSLFKDSLPSHQQHLWDLWVEIAPMIDSGYSSQSLSICFGILKKKYSKIDSVKKKFLFFIFLILLKTKKLAS